MRKMILVAVTLLCSGLWAFAQSTSSTSPSSTSPTTSSTSDMAGQSGSTAGETTSSSSAASTGNNTIEGCLSDTAGNYTLRDKATGVNYNLTGPDSEISSHVGQQVHISGTASGAKSSASANASPSASASAMSNGSGTANISANQSFMVSSVTKVSSSCSNQ